MRTNDAFHRFAHGMSHFVGAPWAFVAALVIVLVWAATGPVFHFSDTWQLVINTGTTIVTFLMVFLIQNTQNKDTTVIQVKLNELIASQPGASNHLIDLEDMSEADLERLHLAFQQLADLAHTKGGGRMTVSDIPGALGATAARRLARGSVSDRDA